MKDIKTTSASEFSIYIEKLANSNNITRIDAILEYCEEKSIDYESILPLLSKGLQDKLQQEFKELNFLQKTPQLQF